eukprot:Gb_15227 [translate_table: standard]
MSLCGGNAFSVLRPSLCKVPVACISPVNRTHVTRPTTHQKLSLQHKINAKTRIPPSSLRSSSSSFIDLGLLRFEMAKFTNRAQSCGGALSSECSVVLSTEILRWVFTVSAFVLMLAKGTGIQKSFLVPLLALEAPGDVVSWIRSDYGLWTAFMVFLVRLFYHIPGELELPLLFVLLVIIAPYQAMGLRGTQAGMVISIAMAAYLAFQHVTRAGGLRKAFEQGTIVASIAIVCLLCVPLSFLIQGFVF